MRRYEIASTPGVNLLNNLKSTVSAFLNNKVPMLGASLAYYTVFSLAPLLLILVGALGFIFGRGEVEAEILSQLESLLGAETSGLISQIITQTTAPESGWISFSVGVAILFVGASAVFRQLKTALNMIWSVEIKDDIPFWKSLRQQLLSVAMIAVIGFLLMVSLIATAVIAILNSYFHQYLPFPALILQMINLFVSFWIIMLSFAFVYKVLSDIKIPWSYVWGGAMISSTLFVGGKELISLYISNSAIISTYGAASSLVVLLIWVFYSAQILLFGASYIKVAADNRGEDLAPESYAYKTKQIPVSQEPNEQEFSELEQIVIVTTGNIFRNIALTIDRKFFHKKKSFWDRVNEKVNEE